MAWKHLPNPLETLVIPWTQNVSSATAFFKKSGHNTCSELRLKRSINSRWGCWGMKIIFLTGINKCSSRKHSMSHTHPRLNQSLGAQLLACSCSVELGNFAKRWLWRLKTGEANNLKRCTLVCILWIFCALAVKPLTSSDPKCQGDSVLMPSSTLNRIRKLLWVSWKAL